MQPRHRDRLGQSTVGYGCSGLDRLSAAVELCGTVRAVTEDRSISFPRSVAALLGAIVVLLFAVGGVIQTGVLAKTIRDGLRQTSHSDVRSFLGHAIRVIPAGAKFASDVPTSAYELYPRQHVRSG